MMAQAGVTSVKAMLLRGVAGIALSPIKEVFQEIIEDGFREALIENLVSIAGGTDDLGFWLSSLSTSFREVKGALGELTFGETNLKNTFSLILAISSGDVDTRLEIEQKITQDLKQRKEAETAKQEQMSFWDKMLKTDFLKGLFMVIPSVFFGSFSFVALSGLNKMITSSIKLSPAAYAKYESWRHIKRKENTVKAVGKQDAFSYNLQEQIKKPAELESAKPEINKKYKATQNTEKNDPPLAAFLSSLNPNPKIETRKNLANKFNTIAFENYFNKWIEGYVLNDERFKAFKSEFKQVQRNYREIGFQKAEKDAINIIKEALEIDKFNLRFLNMFGVEFYDPDFVMIGALGTSARSDGSRLWKQNAFEAKMTTLDKVNEIKSYFDVSGGYAMYVKAKDGQLIYIPVDSETNLADWLEDNHHNIDSKIYVAPKLLKIEQFHTLENWQDHPTYKLYQDMKALLTNRDPDEVTDIELGRLLGQSSDHFSKMKKRLENGFNRFYIDNVLYKWIYNIEENHQFAKDIKNSFRNLVINYREVNGLTYQDPDVDTLVGELRLAIQHEPSLLSNQGPSNAKLNEFFSLYSLSYVFGGAFKSDTVLRLIYGLYRKSSDKFILTNLGKSHISDDMGASLAVKESLLAINKYFVSKNILTVNKLNSLQKLIMLSSWYLSNIHGGGKYLSMVEIASRSNIHKQSISNYITGKISYIRDIEIINNLEDLINDLSETVRKEQRELLKQVYDNYYLENDDHFPGIHEVGNEIKYPRDWDYPQVIAKHYVELLLKQGGLLPAGAHGEGAEDFDISRRRNRHHIDFYKASKDVMNLILLGSLHSSFTGLEPLKNLDYYTLMRYMRDGFEEARPPSFWDENLQDLYIGRLKEFITEWEVTESSIRYTDPRTGEKVDFIKMIYRGQTYNLEGMLKKGWITKEWVDSIIQDLRQKLESRGLL
ncbi:hypothetical protein ES707_04692 [subsurface metagenome]